MNPWSIHSPEAKRLKIQEEKRLGEFNEKMDQYLEERGLMLGLDRVKLNGIKPRMLASQEKTGKRGPPMEVRDLSLMPSSASLSSKKSLYRLEMRRELFDGVGFKMKELKEAAFQRIRDVHEQKFEPIQNIDVPLLNRGFTAPIGSKFGTPSTKKRGGEPNVSSRISDFRGSNRIFGSKQQH